MYNTILVPVDGSKRAERILPYVEELASSRVSTVIFVQVIEPSTWTTGGFDTTLYYDKDLAEQIYAETKSYLAALAGEMREKGIPAKSVIEYGPVVHTILCVADREKADLIAMASHGRTGLARAFYGSVAAGIMHQADRPLLLIRSNEG